MFGPAVVFWILFMVAFLASLVALAMDSQTALRVCSAAMLVAFLVLVTEIVMAWRKG